MAKEFLYKIVRTKSNPKNYRVRIYDGDSHDEFENGKGRWLRDEDTMRMIHGSFVSSVIECHSVDFAFQKIDEWLSIRSNAIIIENSENKSKLPSKPSFLEESVVVLYAEKD